MKQHFETPSKLVFNDIKTKCIIYWKNHFSDEFGYVTQKLNKIEQIKNKEADVMFILNMFHLIIRNHIISTLLPESKNYINYYNNLNK